MRKNPVSSLGWGSWCRRARRLGRLQRIRRVIEVVDGEARRAENAHLGDTVSGSRKPEGTALLIRMNKMHAFSPERWVLGGLTLGPHKGVILGVYPDPPLEQTLLVTLRGEVDCVGWPEANYLSTHHMEFVIVRAQASLYEYLRVRCFCL